MHEEYAIVKAAGPLPLVTEVNDRLKDGWMVSGNLVALDGRDGVALMQPIMRHVYDTAAPLPEGLEGKKFTLVGHADHSKGLGIYFHVPGASPSPSGDEVLIGAVRKALAHIAEFGALDAVTIGGLMEAEATYTRQSNLLQDPDAQVPPLTKHHDKILARIVKERARQIIELGHDAKHDDELPAYFLPTLIEAKARHVKGGLIPSDLMAGITACGRAAEGVTDGNDVELLVEIAALCMAEIERRYRHSDWEEREIALNPDDHK